MRTWHKEALLVACVLACTVVATGGKAVEALGSVAVLVGFMHAQVGFRLSEAEAGRPLDQHKVECHRWMDYYFMAKEALWFTYFLWLGAWSALVGVGVFLCYPVWRRRHLAKKVAPAPPAAA